MTDLSLGVNILEKKTLIIQHLGYTVSYCKKKIKVLWSRKQENIHVHICTPMCLGSQSCLDSVTPGLQPARLLCSWNFLDKNTGVGCYFLLQGIFPTQELNPYLLRWHVGSLPLSHLRSLVFEKNKYISLTNVTLFLKPRF